MITGHKNFRAWSIDTPCRKWSYPTSEIFFSLPLFLIFGGEIQSSFFLYFFSSGMGRSILFVGLEFIYHFRGRWVNWTHNNITTIHSLGMISRGHKQHNDPNNPYRVRSTNKHSLGYWYYYDRLYKIPYNPDSIQGIEIFQSSCLPLYLGYHILGTDSMTGFFFPDIHGWTGNIG